MALGLVQQRQTIHRHIFGTLGHHRRQQMPPMAHPPLQRRMLEQRRGIGQTAHDPVRVFFQRQRQIELRARLRRTQPTDLEFAKIQLTLWRVLPREHHLEQRRMRQTARRLHPFHHLLERDVLMRLCLQGTFLHRCQQLRQRRRARQFHPQRQRVDEEPDQPLALRATTIGRRAADHHIVLTRKTRQQQRPTRQERHIQRQPMPLAEFLQRLRLLWLHDHFQHRAGMLLPRRTRTIRRQFQQHRRTRQRLAPVCGLLLQHLARQPLPLPARIIGVLDRQRR